MNKRRCALIATIMIGLASASQADAAANGNACSAWLGRTAEPMDLETAVAGLRDLPAKDEFETTKQYRIRLASALKDSARELVIEKRPVDRASLKYDADARVLRIDQWAFVGYSRWDFTRALTSAGAHDQVVPGARGSYGAVVESTDRKLGRYVASNAFGAAVEVRRIERRTNAIFERSSKSSLTNLFPDAKGVLHELEALPLEPDEARRLKQELRIAFVVKPREPYLVTGRLRATEPTIRDPRDVVEEFAILVADIRCGLVMDRNGKVLGAYRTY